MPLASQDRARFFSICGPDERAPIERKLAIGRLYSTVRNLPVCTAWLAPNGSFVTAGHCVQLGFDELEFDVPPTGCDGSVVRPGPSSRFQIDSESIVFRVELEDGQDWAIFRIVPNSSIGLPRYVSDGWALALASAPLSADRPGPVLVAGFGDDYRERDGCFRHNRVLQSAPGTGHNGTDERDWFFHDADTHIGNSGSPVFSYDAAGRPVVHGIHRGGNCPNVSTAVIHPEFMRALNGHAQNARHDPGPAPAVRSGMFTAGFVSGARYTILNFSPTRGTVPGHRARSHFVMPGRLSLHRLSPPLGRQEAQ